MGRSVPWPSLLRAKTAKNYLLFLAEVLRLEVVLFAAEVLCAFLLFLQTRLFLLVLSVALLLVDLLLVEALRLFLAEDAEVLFLELRFSIVMISFHLGSLLASVMN